MEVYNVSSSSTTTRGWETALAKLKEAVETDEYGIYALKVRARKAFGLTTAEVFMEMYTASFLTKDPEGWFFKTYDWWWEKHGLSERNVKTGYNNLLAAGVIGKKNGQGNRMYFRVLPAAVIETLYPDSQDETSELTDRPIQSGRNVRSSQDETSVLVRTKRPDSYKEKSKRNVKEVVSTQQTYNTNEKASTVSAPYGRSAGDREQRKRDQGGDTNGSGDFGSSRSSEASENTPPPLAPAIPPPEDEAGWVPEKVLAVYERQRDLLSLPALEDSMRQKFLREFDTLRSERQVDEPTLRAVLRQMLLKAGLPLSPLFAHNDVWEKSDEHPPMSIDALSEWCYEHRPRLVRGEAYRFLRRRRMGDPIQQVQRDSDT